MAFSRQSWITSTFKPFQEVCLIMIWPSLSNAWVSQDQKYKNQPLCALFTVTEFDPGTPTSVSKGGTLDVLRNGEPL
eukprot:1153862-Pelagomonas_calceolata.AAC.7